MNIFLKFHLRFTSITFKKVIETILEYIIMQNLWKFASKSIEKNDEAKVIKIINILSFTFLSSAFMHDYKYCDVKNIDASWDFFTAKFAEFICILSFIFCIMWKYNVITINERLCVVLCIFFSFCKCVYFCFWFHSHESHMYEIQ